MFCCTPSITQRAAFSDTYHLANTSARTCGHKGGLLQLSSVRHLRTTVTTAAVCLQRLRSSRVFGEEVRAHNSTLRELHWLQVPERIQFRLCVLVYRCLNGTAPSYLAETLHMTADLGSRQRLRSASTSTLVIPSTRRTTLGDRAFPVAAARAWNALPPSVRSASSLLQFRCDMKTALFQSPYSSP